MATIKRLWNPLFGVVVIISVVVIEGATTTSSTVTTTNTAGSASTTSPTTSNDTTSVPAVTATSNSAAISTTLDSITSVGSVSTSTPTFEVTTLSSSLVNSSTTNASETTTPNPPRPEDSNTNIKPDPLGNLTTRIMMSSTSTPGTTLKTSPVPPSPISSNGDKNPYNNIPNARSPPLNPRNPQTQQQLLSPFLFMGSDFFPFFLLHAHQQNSQRGSRTNTATNNFAPLYMTAMDMDLWPLLFTQQRSQQQQAQRPGSPTQRTPQHIQSRNNLASTWFFLNEF